MDLREINEKVERIVLADGKEYEIPVPNIDSFIMLEDLMNCSIEDIFKEFERRKLKSTVLMLYVVLKQRYENIEMADVKKLLNFDNLAEVSNVLLSQITKAVPSKKKVEKVEEMNQ